MIILQVKTFAFQLKKLKLVFLLKFNKDSSPVIKGTQFPLMVTWVCIVHKVKGFRLDGAVICFKLFKQKKAVKVGFVVCKGVFVAYIFYCTNQCSFIWHIWHDPYFCSKWNHSTVNWRQTLTDGGSVWSIYVLYNYLWLRKTLFCDCSCYRFFCKNFAAISIKIAWRYKYL